MASHAEDTSHVIWWRFALARVCVDPAARNPLFWHLHCPPVCCMLMCLARGVRVGWHFNVDGIFFFTPPPLPQLNLLFLHPLLTPLNRSGCAQY